MAINCPDLIVAQPDSGQMISKFAAAGWLDWQLRPKHFPVLPGFPKSPGPRSEPMTARSGDFSVKQRRAENSVATTQFDKNGRLPLSRRRCPLDGKPLVMTTGVLKEGQRKPVLAVDCGQGWRAGSLVIRTADGKTMMTAKAEPDTQSANPRRAIQDVNQDGLADCRDSDSL